jgi:hypothetical protein
VADQGAGRRAARLKRREVLNKTEAQPQDLYEYQRVGDSLPQVTDVNRSVTFYTQHLGFVLHQQAGSAFAKVS